MPNSQPQKPQQHIESYALFQLPTTGKPTTKNMFTELAIDLTNLGERIDKALADAHPNLSRAQWQRLIQEGQVVVAGTPVKASQRVSAGMIAHALIPAPRETALVPENIPLDIRYEDEDLLVVNKSAGMVVHPGSGNETGTLVHAVLAYCPDLPGIGGEKRPGIVHRLDKETSGLIIIAKNERAIRALQHQFKTRTIQKRYLALVDGQIQPPRALIDAPIGRDIHQRKRMSVIAHENARKREALTEYERLTVYAQHSLVACHPLTGRTHQIRVHLAYIGYPIVGDTVYGRQKPTLPLKRYFLHAHQLVFVRPSDKKQVELTAEMPPELQTILDQLH